MANGRRVAVITGAAQGIGQAHARRLASDGFDVVSADLADADETGALVTEAGGEHLSVVTDVSDPDGVAALGDAVAERFGRADVLVANAGIYPIVTIDEMDFDDWRRVMSINLDSLFLLTKAFLPGMREAGWGRIVVTASTVFHDGTPGLVHYVASKGGVIGFVRGLAGEIGEDGVTINAIAPSLVRTPGTEEGPHEEMGFFEAISQAQAIKRTQTPDDLVGALSFLASDDAAFITGQTLAVDGGWVRL